MSVNLVVLKGNLTRDPELSLVGQKNTPKVRMGLAVNRSYKKGEDWVKEVSFFDIDVWGRQAENCAQYLSKGRPALVQGELRQDTWEQEDGQKRSKVSVVATNVEFLGYGDQTEGKKEPEDEVPF